MEPPWERQALRHDVFISGIAPPMGWYALDADAASKDKKLQASTQALARILQEYMVNLDSDTLEVVWVANRNNPVKDSSGVLKISEDGNLQLIDGQNMSFEHLTNSLLPQISITIDKDNTYENSILRSWKSTSDPSDGRYWIGISHLTLPEFITWDGDRPYWRSGPWNGNLFLGVPRWWSDGSRMWENMWQSIESECDIYGKCGPFGSCNRYDSPIFSCLKGFEPKT
ncbi:hypothetical protein RDABS01_037747 [Bienertia sinuspersici]